MTIDKGGGRHPSPVCPGDATANSETDIVVHVGAPDDCKRWLQQSLSQAGRDNREIEFGEKLAAAIPALRRYARAMTRDTEAADDLVQDTLTRAIEKQHLWKPGSNMRAWAATILHNLLVSQYRQKQRAGLALSFEEMGPYDSRPSDQMSHLTLQAVDAALTRLPVKLREAIVLVTIQGLKYQEAAEITQVPVGTVRSRLSRGRAFLKEMLDGDSDEALQVTRISEGDEV